MCLWVCKCKCFLSVGLVGVGVGFEESRKKSKSSKSKGVWPGFKVYKGLVEVYRRGVRVLEGQK